MKTLFTLVLIILVSFQAVGQKKSKVDPKDAQIDSLTLLSKNLTLKLDSVSLELIKYVGLYNTIKEKVIHYNFDPARSSYLIDSLKASRDSSYALLSVLPKSPSQADSMQVTPATNITAIPSDDIEKSRAISSLKQLKELLDNNIITEAEFIAMKRKYLEKL
jgi:hypothetical protein